MKLPALLRIMLKMVVALMAFLVTIEVCSRVDDSLRYGAPLWTNYSADRLKTGDGGIPHNLPKVRFEKWQHNSLGFRGPEVSAAKPPGTLRIICMGASESYGLYEGPGKEWPAQLQRLLLGTRFQVLNASVAGLGLRQYEAYLDKYVLPLDPDVVILFINPLFYATNLEQAGTTRPPQGEAVKTGNHAIPLPPRVTFAPRSLSKIKQGVKQALKESFPHVLKRYQVWNMEREIASAERRRLKGRKPKDAVPEIYLARFHDDLAGLVSSLSSRGIQVVLSSYPALMCRENLDRHAEVFLDNRRFFVEFSLTGMTDIVERFNVVVRSVAAEQGALFVDSCALIPKSTDYFGDNVHYTDRGARTIAEGVAGVLLGPGRALAHGNAGREKKPL